jgi:CreA protein
VKPLFPRTRRRRTSVSAKEVGSTNPTSFLTDPSRCLFDRLHGCATFWSKVGETMTQGWKVKWGVGFAAALVVLALLVHWHNLSEKRNILGSVNTEFKLIGPDHKIIIESYDDPKIDGITVFISKSQTGGIEGALGLAEDTSDASVAVRQTGRLR